MIYNNADLSAIDAMERARTGNYGEDGYHKPRSRFLGICECHGCSTEIYSDDMYYEVTPCGGLAECGAFSGDGEVKLVCKSCMNILEMF